MRPRSFAGPVVLIALGALFLISNIRPDLSLWRMVDDYWPIALIIFGVIRIAEVLFSAQSGTLGTTRVRPMGFGWIFLIIIVGLMVSIPSHIGRGIHFRGFRSGGVELFGEEFDYPVTANAPAPGIKRVVLDNIRGTVSITGVEATEIHVDGHKMIRAYDRGSADTVNSSANVNLVTEGDVLFVRSTENRMPENSRVSMDLQISVPSGVSVEARGRTGDLSVSSVKGSVDVSSQRGEVRLSDIGGDAKLEVSRCDLIRATNVKGLLDLQGDGREIQLDNIEGQVTISGRYSGNLEFRNLAKPLKFKSEQTDLRVEKIPGSINMDLGDLRATNLVGPIHLITHTRDIHMDDFTGPLDIEVGSGDIDLKPGKGTLARIDVRSRKGNIELALPASGAFDLKASTDKGEVTNDFGPMLVSDTTGHGSVLRSGKPQGAVVVVTTERGEVSIRKVEQD